MTGGGQYRHDRWQPSCVPKKQENRRVEYDMLSNLLIKMLNLLRLLQNMS